MTLDKAAVGRIARLARIRISDDELDLLAGELSGILDWIEKLDEVDVGGVEPMTGVVDSVLPVRGDAVESGGDAGRILANAPETEDSYFVVPKVIE